MPGELRSTLHWFFGTANLVVELLSMSSMRRDRLDNKDLYARFGVKEYWIGDPAKKTIEVFVLEQGRYRWIVLQA